jgi:hypothetical protein
VKLIDLSESFLGFLQEIDSGVLPIVTFAFWAMGDLSATQERMKMLEVLLPIEVLSWFDILDEKQGKAFSIED